MFLYCAERQQSASELLSGTVANSIYEVVAKNVKELNVLDNIGLVVGATEPDVISWSIRELFPLSPFLIPGVGFQGGDLSSCVEAEIKWAWHN